ncbi:hypothetical protein N7474_002892 [Penicillium riverlandense]|uniref:uncharacterized protein n=1 Tax=Penicillium riverlandense TaxID=1903569 RepID=UPI002547B966|nr:uncharacterized protein N7474_002892 [Penicillium riverlandense]KAJ5825754.1 hypothetical protein N7474_002892 [Penicillium riverlandense]
MVVLLGSRPTKSVLVILCLLIVFVIHQLSFAIDSAFASRISDSLDIIDRCIPDGLQPLNNSKSVAEPEIPSIVHQIWKTTDVRTFSKEMKASHDVWKDKTRPFNYTVKLWTDDDVLRLIKTKYAWLLSTYEEYSHNIQRADIARLVVLHAEGGLYADLDVFPRDVTKIQCLQRLGLPTIFAPTSAASGLSNHFILAERGSSFLEWALYKAKRRGAASRHILLPYLQVFWSTGPTMVTAAFQEYAWLHSGQQHNLGLIDDGYVRAMVGHAAGRSWHGPDGRALNYVADHGHWLMVVSFLLMTVFVLVCVVKRGCWGEARGFLQRTVYGGARGVYWSSS